MEIRQSTVSELVDKAVLGDINIPIFQRDFEWSKDRVELLLDSLLRGYPIGSLLFWNAEYAFPRSTSSTGKINWIIDGQQRITSLCILFNKKPYWWDGKKRLWNQITKLNRLWVNVRSDDPQLSVKQISVDKSSWIEIQQILSLTDDKELRLFVDNIARKAVQEDSILFTNERSEKGFHKLEESDISEEDETELDEEEIPEELDEFAFYYDSYENVHDLARKIEGRIRRILKIKEIQIPQIVTRKPPTDMARIFARLNRGGMKLSAPDVFLAILSSALPKWVKNDFGPFCEEMTRKSGINLDPSYYVRILTAHTLQTVDTRKLLSEKSGQMLSPTKIKNSWLEVKPAIVDVLRGLWEKGIQSEKIIPSKSTLIPLVVMKSLHPSTFNMDKALSWLMAANFHGYGSDSEINYDVNIIHDSKNFLEARDKLLSVDEIGFKWSFDKDEFDRKRRGIKTYKFILYLLLYRRRAKDWFTGGHIGFTCSDGDWSQGYRPHWHHIFPKARITNKARLASVDSLANLTVINERTNIRISATRPNEYLHNIPKKQLKAHLIPLDENLWEIRRFNRFVNARANLLERAINTFIKQLG